MPCADEVFRLQKRDAPECKLFQQFCDEGHYTGNHSTRQGHYVATPNGRLLASMNRRSPRQIRRMLEEALEAWKAIPTQERKLSPEQRHALEGAWRWADEWPEDGLVLSVTSRDLLREEQQRARSRGWSRGRRRRWTSRAWNHDWAWFSRDEARSWLPDELRVGATQALPKRLGHRLACFTLLDNVRGQTIVYEPESVEHVELTTEVVGVGADSVEVRITGTTQARVDQGEWPRSLATTLRGHATWNLKQQRFESFELVALGTRRGATRFNERRRDPGPAPIGFVLRQAAEDSPHIAPSFVWRYGWKRRGR